MATIETGRLGNTGLTARVAVSKNTGACMITLAANGEDFCTTGGCIMIQFDRIAIYCPKLTPKLVGLIEEQLNANKDTIFHV